VLGVGLIFNERIQDKTITKKHKTTDQMTLLSAIF